MKLTLVGPGKMALALARGLEKEHELTIVGRDGEKLLRFAEALTRHADTALLDKYDIEGQTVILCVKPHALESVAKALKGRAAALYSVLAGVSIETLRKGIKAEHYIRAMPNLAAEFFASMTTLTGDSAKKREAETIFGAIGDTLWVESEKSLDIATAVAGSGPAYLALVAESLADGAVAQGLKREEAAKLVEGLFKGFAPLIAATHPAMIKEAVMSPGGTTAAGCLALERHAVRAAFAEAIVAAYARVKI